MATKAKKVTKKVTKKANKTSKVVKKINNELVNASIAAINTTISNGEKWQELATKLVKESESVRTQQLNMFFDTAEALKKQANAGSKRMQKLVGLDSKMVEKAKDFAMNNPISKKVVGMAEDVSEMVSENPMVKKAEKTAAEIKAMGMAKYNDVKGDVLEQASKIIDKGEAMIKDAKKAPKSKAKKVVKKAKSTPKKVVKKATVTKAKSTPKKVVKKATVTKAKTTAAKAKAVKKVAKVATKTTAKAKVAKKAVSATPKAKAAKVVTKTAPKAKTINKVEKTVVVTKTVKTSVKDDLKLIYGIGPKTEVLLNTNGIMTYADVAKTEVTKFESILEAAGGIYANLDAKDWKKQAEVAVKGGAKELEKWVEKNRTA